MPDIALGGYVTHYEDDDFTPPWLPTETVLIQHGFARNANFWHHWVPRIGDSYRVVRRDLRGHGGSSDAAAVPWEFDRLVEDMRDFCDALGLEQVHLVGESTGGMIAVGFAARYPERLLSLTLCNAPTTIGAGGQAFFAGDHATWQDALAALGTGGWVDWLMAQPGTSAFDSQAERDWARAEMARADRDALIGYSRVISGTDVAKLLPVLAVPTLVLAPTRSAAAPLDEQKAIAAALPQGRLVVIDGQAHEIYRDRADDCVRAWRDHAAASAQRRRLARRAMADQHLVVQVRGDTE